VTSEERIRGRLHVHPRGFGFLNHDEGGDSSFVPPRELNGFLVGDLVSAEVVTGNDGRTSVKALELIERGRAEIFGVLTKKRGKPYVQVDPRTGNSDWPLDGVPKGQPEGSKLVATVQGKRARWARAVADEDAGLDSVRVRWGVRATFPDPCLKAAKAAAKPKLGKRRDLRKIPTLTIDAPSSRDLDDALAVLPPQADGAVRVLVSIADVGSVVTPGSVLDVEARERGTSVYLPDRVTPMLPRELSENALSLLEGQDRAALTVELRIDPQGRVTATDLCESLIRSHARLSYADVSRFLDEGDRKAVPESVQPTLRWLRTAAARLAAVRSSRGGVRTFSRTEVKLQLDKEGEPVGLKTREENCANRLIERLMVAANEAVAQWLLDRGLPGLYRVMDEPDAESVANLAEFARHFGFETGFGERLTSLAVAAFEEQFQTATVAPSIRTVFRRVLGPARYDPEPSSHFALGAPLYLHFTSPIRRYADLAVHRVIKAHLKGDRDQDPADPKLTELAGDLNDAAYRAKRAESERLNMLIARLFSGRIGERFDANVVGVKPFGLIVQLAGLGVSGTVGTDALPGGPYSVDPKTESLKSKTRSFVVGDALNVVVLATDEEQGRIELGL
jgi:ribonuclease R